MINSKWNRSTIEAMTVKYNIDLNKAEEIYRDIRFYTHGIATQLCCSSTKLSAKELKRLITNMIKVCLNSI